MANNRYLAREDAPFGTATWQLLDQTMVETARSQLTGRRLLPIEGPYGLGLKTVPLRDEASAEGLVASKTLPVVLIQEHFTLPTRDLLNYEQEGVALDTTAVQDAALSVARREDALLFEGHGDVPGLMNTVGVQSLEISAWESVGAAADELIEAVSLLDEAGFHGPYSLALTPRLYNRLLRRYPQGNMTELQHLQQMITDGIVKAPALEAGGVLLASDRQHASIVLGQDMTIGFIGPAGSEVEFSLSESLTVRVRHPQAVCILEA
jgi:uncharacterized linocin/CFP29 family protein